MDYARIELEGKTYEFPVTHGTEGEKAFDIANLRDKTGFVTLDIGYQNTGSCVSSITYTDGEKGILRYRGIDLEDLCANSTFIETAYLLIYGKLPAKEERTVFSYYLTENSLLHEDMINFFVTIPPLAHPMAILSTMVSSLAVFYPKFYVQDDSEANFRLMVARLISKIRTIAAFSYKKSIGEPFVYPRHDLAYCANFLNMMFSSPVKPYDVDPEIENLLNTLLIVQADHEQNCSTSTVRLVGSSKVNLYSSICAGVNALWGPLHGGANQDALVMLEEISSSKMSVAKVLEKAKNKESGFRLSGFGHRVYKNYDPRARVLKERCLNLVERGKLGGPLVELALRLEEAALKDDYFIERKLFPNVDFYSGLLYRVIGIPTDMFTVMFAMGRMPGWIAHWKEMHEFKPFKIGRPRQIYVGSTKRDYIPVDERT